jgi:DNA-directed RNA polymerase sigma subunit (sigma70/sigma32)
MAHVYLSGIAAATERMLELRDEIVYQRDLVQTKDLTAERVQTSGIGNPTEQRAFKVIALREKLDEQIAELLEYRTEAIDIMGEAKLTRAEEQVLRRHYFAGDGRAPTWETIADELSYSVRAVYKIRNRALRKVAQVINNAE